MSDCRRDSACKTSDPPSQLQRQVRVWGDRSSILSQHEIDTIYTAVYGEPTQQDRNDFLLLFLGLHEDIIKLQEELLENTAGGADAMAIAPCFYGRLNVIMEERIEILAKGKPLVVKGFPPTYPGRMMSRWVREYGVIVPSLYDRIEDLLAARVPQSLPQAPPAVFSTSASRYLSGVDAETESATGNLRKGHGDW